MCKALINEWILFTIFRHGLVEAEEEGDSHFFDQTGREEGGGGVGGMQLPQDQRRNQNENRLCYAFLIPPLRALYGYITIHMCISVDDISISNRSNAIVSCRRRLIHN